MATQTEVDAACEAIAARGERPTVERVRVSNSEAAVRTP
jgi:hypothetical protein